MCKEDLPQSAEKDPVDRSDNPLHSKRAVSLPVAETAAYPGVQSELP